MRWFLFISLMYMQVVRAQDIVHVEYFLDEDPGYGLGQPIAISANTNTVDILSEIDINEISNGVHTLYFRVKDGNNLWSHTHSRVFVKEATSPKNTPPTVSAVEYFLNEDPGRGLGQAVAIAANTTTLNVQPEIDLSEVSGGVHTLYLRVKDSHNLWGQTYSRVFLKEATSPGNTTPVISHVEYFLDEDPGFGTPLSVSSAIQIDQEATINLSDVENGFHTIYSRARDNHGSWSHTHSKSFVKLHKTQREPISNISTIAYYFDMDPGKGNRLSIQIDQSPSVDVSASLNLEGKATGTHTLFIKTLDEEGTSSFIQNHEVFIDNCELPTPGFLAEPTCLGETLTFEDQSLGVDSNTIYSWDFGNDGTIESNQNGNLTHLFEQEGVLEVELKLQNGTLCKDSITHQINILPLPNLDIGNNVMICEGDSVQLEASATGAFSWEPGDGLSQTDIENPFAKPKSTTEYTLTVSADNGCSNTDQLTVTVHETYSTTLETEICKGDSIILEGAYQKLAGVYIDSLQSILGCDSIINTTLIVNELPQIDLGEDFTLCGNCEENLDAGAGFEAYAWSNGLDIQAITVDEPGEYFVKVTDANGCSNADTVVVDQVLGINDNFEFLGIGLFPNPTDRWINLMINNHDGLQEVRILISNILGKAIEERVIELKLGENPVILDYKHLAKGLYNILFISEKGEIYKKILLE